MPPSIPSPNLHTKPIPLTEKSFLQFGTLIQNPAHCPKDPTTYAVESSNQGSALKYKDITNLTNHYPNTPSKIQAKPVMNMFVSSPRKLRQTTISENIFEVKILERHPYTPQTFIPLGLPSNSKTKYLIIVAPTLPSPKSSHTPNLSTFTNSSPALAKTQNKIQQTSSSDNTPTLSTFTNSSPTLTKIQQKSIQPTPDSWPRGPGLPDLSRITAFIADGSQAITYGAGTWHAPMVVLGDQAVDFVVVQWANGVSEEDCQEVLLEGGELTIGLAAAEVRAKL